MLTIRHLKSASDLDAYMDICIYCFAMPPSYGPVYAKFVGQHLEHSWGAFENDRLVAAMWYIPYEMNTGSAYIPMGGVAAVAVRPEARNLGLAKTLMTKAHRQMKDEGRPLAALQPFKPEFYARMGYGDVFYYQECKIPPGEIEKLTPKGYRLQSVDGFREWKNFERLHALHGSAYFGTVKRSNAYWQARYLRSALGTRQHYLITKGGEAAGFIISHLDKAAPRYTHDPGHESKLSIVQAVWTDQGSFDMILQFIRAHRDQFDKITWWLPTNVSIHDRLIDQRIEVKIKPKMMLKLVDVKRAIELRPYASDLNAEVHVRVAADDTSTWNDGLWRLQWSRGEAKVTKAKSAPRGAVITASIQAFSVLYSGHHSASRLAELGHLTGPRPAIELLDRAFPPQACFMEEWF